MRCDDTILPQGARGRTREVWRVSTLRNEACGDGDPDVSLFWQGIELVEGAFQVVEFLAGFGEFAFRGEALVVGEVAAGLGDEGLRSRPAGSWRGALRTAGAGFGASGALSDEDSEPKRDASAASKVGA